MPDSQAAAKPREDVVISVCFSDLPETNSAFQAVRDLAERLDALYRFREIILIVDDTQRERYLGLVEQVSELRLFTVHPAIGHYERRVIAAEEAIGDIVLIAAATEIACLDLPALLKQAEDAGSIVLATRAGRRARTGLALLTLALGRLAGFRIDPGDLQTIALPRTLLNRILAHEEPELALRFPLRDPGLPLTRFPAGGKTPARRAPGQFRRRMRLLQRLLVYLAPTLLLCVSVSSAILTLLGIGYAFYMLGAWLVVAELAPGWLTTSAMLSLSATFMGLSTLGLSLGLQQLLNQRRKAQVERIAHEVNRIDLFGKMASDLNVEIAGGGGQPHPARKVNPDAWPAQSIRLSHHRGRLLWLLSGALPLFHLQPYPAGGSRGQTHAARLARQSGARP